MPERLGAGNLHGFTGERQIETVEVDDHR